MHTGDVEETPVEDANGNVVTKRINSDTLTAMHDKLTNILLQQALMRPTPGDPSWRPEMANLQSLAAS